MSERIIAIKPSPTTADRQAPIPRVEGTPPQVASNPVSTLPHACLGNQAMLELLHSGALQAKLHVSQPDDADEVEADRMASHIVRSTETARVQRKCSCSGGVTCAKCAEQEETEGPRQKTLTSPVLYRAAADRPTPGAKGTTKPLARPAHLIVEDNAASLEHGQMHKSEFLKLLKSSVSHTADAALAANRKKIKSAPYVSQWLDSYADREAEALENTLLRYAPEARGAHSAREYIAHVTGRVERAVISWAKTGQITGVPEDLARQFSGNGARGGFLGAIQTFASSSVGGAILGFLGGGGSKLQRKAESAAVAAPRDASAVKSHLGAGHPLDSRVQSQMSSAFGYDFSGVRVHTDSGAASLSRQLSARAFTIGHDVAFGSGEYQPGTPLGDALIAHELAHVVQQGGGQSSTPLTKGEDSSGELEQDADDASLGFVASSWARGLQGFSNLRQNAGQRLRSGVRLQRCSCGHGAGAAKSPAFSDAPPKHAATETCTGSPIHIEMIRSRDLTASFELKPLAAAESSSGATILVPSTATLVKQHEEGTATLAWSNASGGSGRETGDFVHDWENNSLQSDFATQQKFAIDAHIYGMSGRPGLGARTKAESKGFQIGDSDWEFVEDLVFTTSYFEGSNEIKRCKWGFRYHSMQRSGGKQGKPIRTAKLQYWGVDSEKFAEPFPIPKGK
jgi:Domain of unknown function (DUF4157)